MTRKLATIALIAVVGCAGTKHQTKQTVANRVLAAELVARGQWSAAFEVVQPICAEFPDDAEALMLRGIIYTEQKLLDEAQADLEQAVRLAPGMAKGHSALAIIYEMRGRSGDAIKEHRRAVELVPNNPGYLNNLAFSLFASGKAQEAIPIYHEALRGAPMDRKVRNNLGFAYAAAGDFRRAAEQFDAAGEPWEAKNNLGWAYERRGAFTQAYELYGEALRLAPESRIAHQNLSRVAATLGKEAIELPVPHS